jgi:phage tail-like protein
MAGTRTEPYHTFRFHIEFHENSLSGKGGNADVPLCRGAFSECTGLEATMEPKVIKEGGLNYGAHQRAGPVTFATVVLKRGIGAPPGLWSWFDLVSHGAYTYRLTATITMYDNTGSAVTAWTLDRALPIKYKMADLNARATEVGIEELHLAHEGLNVVPPKHKSILEVAS